MNTTTFTFKAVMNDKLDSYDEETIVKNIWPGMYTFLTRRHGVSNGTISLQDGAVEIEWKYEDNYEEDEDV
jgi:hypothetical protein